MKHSQSLACIARCPAGVDLSEGACSRRLIFNTPANMAYVDSATGKGYLIYDTYAAIDIFVCMLYCALVS